LVASLGRRTLEEPVAEKVEGKSRYVVICPACTTRFRPGKSSPIGLTTLPCPNCSTVLEYVPKNDNLVFLSSIASALILAYVLGYRGLTFVLVTIGGAVLTLMLITGALYHIWPPKAQPSSVGLRLTEKPPR
jgi:hypothetical protein